MIYFCADDYGINKIASQRIQKCIEQGPLNKVSVFPNFDKLNLEKIVAGKKVLLSLHLNIVEGKCMAEPGEINLLVDDKGNFKHTFGGLLKLNLFKAEELKKQLYKEIKTQILFWKDIIPSEVDFCIDSHQHTHMIPAVFKVLLKVLKEENIDLKYMRIPAEPVLPFVKVPSLWFTYRPVNIIKQWLLKFLWLINRGQAKKLPTALFMGILFSGKMDEKRVKKILPEYKKIAEKKGMDIEVLFHPGYLSKDETDFNDKNVVFEGFYLSGNRKTEFDSVMKM